ncbi:hypothetical protein BD309DRAFT_1022683 [Dichomitus squalens]|uniref:Uncharacterized protein n=2 Tax=Dichomitus squalens TaxID=114155 RepID=A0A4V2K310_9APHY|nr:uncharacterized protein DICSQDRAFT_172376 [Dichomitus squalens LYAD-421 SS1]EJF59054.1 hypothetical protein DICSQDRAFT_172376 [Dichomitus squalens LYAD-421 SS1]TBU38673.1 hypothetical protein BD309DRAFT_1022683 [Dichomitus squalens]TBU57715.1 hypothetical protein BD310DRAFT_977884 [Dichomitus squalens]
MSSIFQGRRKHQRPVPVTSDHDPWGMHGDASSDEAEASTSTRTAAVRIMSTVRRFSYSTPKKRERGYSSCPDMFVFAFLRSKNLVWPEITK